jgi:HEAT repeat protein
MKPQILLLLAVSPLVPLAAQRPPRPARRPAAPRPAVAPTPAPALPSVDVWLEPLFVTGEPLDLDVPFPMETPLAPEPLDFSFDEAPLIAAGEPLSSTFESVSWGGGSADRVPAFARRAPDDSLYRMAREALNRGEYHRAAELFTQFETANPSSQYVAASMYWRAFARYRAGREDDLRAAVKVLDEQRRRFPEAGDDADVRVLFTRVMGALAARGDTDAVRRLRQGADQGDKPCDREEIEVRAEALSALAGTDPSSVSGVVKRVLADRDECTEPLRRRAVYLLGKAGDADAADALLDAAKNDPSARVRSDAITRLGQLPGDRQVGILTQLMASSNDEDTQMAVVDGLRRSEDPAAHGELRRIIEREDLSERVRVGAIRSLARGGWTPFAVAAGWSQNASVVTRRREAPSLADDDATYLRGLYGRVQSRSVKLGIVQVMAEYGGDAGDSWLMGLARDPSEDARLRSAALSRLQRADVSVAELAKLYDTLTDRQLRSTMVQILGARSEPEATDKLLDIARHDTDPSIRRRAISALARKKDPRTTKLLLELVEK